MIDAAQAERPAAHLHRGDFRQCLEALPPESAALVLTDPPWADRALQEVITDLGRLAARVLVPGGSLVTYLGHHSLPTALPALAEHLRFWWLCSVRLHGPAARLPGKWVMPLSRPLVWYVKGGRRDRRWVKDSVDVHTVARKAAHPWAQHTEVAKYYIEALTEPGELVVDPFAGSGTVPHCAAQLGRRWAAADIDPACWDLITEAKVAAEDAAQATFQAERRTRQ